ncbi:MAG TPA: PPC domain-containing protein [Kofleriaceae bacterium]|nr:PPC domain-containing protein [Kofleriaceae bacterium]
MLGRFIAVVLSVVVFAAPGCGPGRDPSAGATDPDDEYGMDGPVSPVPAAGKEDGATRRGLLVNTDTTRTQVWTARNRWEDRDTAAARRVGLAWGADSGLSWDEKYALWVQSMERTASVDGRDTFLLTTPWGKSLPSPALECAEMSIFLRVSFAAWYELPFFMEAVDEGGRRVYFGHNGVRTESGRYASTPEFALQYADHSGLSPEEIARAWPRDEALRRRSLAGGTDEQPMLGEGATFGTYADEIHLNKRAGHFLLLALNYLGSANVADSANTYNIVPEAVRPGDSLLERWQRIGIGHTLVVKDVTELGEGNLDVSLVSGSMPRRQGVWESGVQSKQYFTDERTGGEGENSDGDAYAALGGGLKRWRVTKNMDGYWTNTWMLADEAHWINSSDLARIAARPARFEQLLDQVSPEQEREGLLASIEDARQHLRSYPASCAARERRERAFADLYDLMEREFGVARADVDRTYRIDDDYVLAELDYARSKTCCWNSTTGAMYRIVMEQAAAERAAADADGECRAPTVFMNQADGYERWRTFAANTGRGAEWAAWSEDETCAQRDAEVDREAAHGWTDYCAWQGGGSAEADCSDSHEPNDGQASATALGSDPQGDLSICPGDSDWFAVAAGGQVRIEFSHAGGDLDLAAFDASGAQTAVSDGTSDSETVAVPAGGAVRVYGYEGATNTYRIVVP